MQALYQTKRRKISLTALIDVVFILLLFFMLTTQFQRLHAVDVRTASNANAQTTTPEPPALFLLSNDGLIHLHNNTTHNPQKRINSAMPNADASANTIRLEILNTPNDTEDKRAAIAKLIAHQADRTAVLLPYENTTLQTTLSAMTTLQAIGLANVSLGRSVPSSAEHGVPHAEVRP